MRMNYSLANSIWSGRSDELKKWLIKNKLMDANARFFWRQGISRFMNNHTIKIVPKKTKSRKRYSANANFLQFMNDSKVTKNKEIPEIGIDEELSNILNINNMTLHDYHMKILDINNYAARQSLGGAPLLEVNHLIGLLENTDPLDAHRTGLD